MSDPIAAIDLLKRALDDFEAGRLDVDRFCLEWRRVLLELGAAVPAALAETGEALLMRAESARWFSGEACGFSGKDLALALRRWLAAVEQALSH